MFHGVKNIPVHKNEKDMQINNGWFDSLQLHYATFRKIIATLKRISFTNFFERLLWAGDRKQDKFTFQNQMIANSFNNWANQCKNVFFKAFTLYYALYSNVNITKPHYNSMQKGCNGVNPQGAQPHGHLD